MEPKLSSSDEMFHSYSLRSQHSKSDKLGAEPGTSYEVFRNNTTAIELIVKEVPNKYRKTKDFPLLPNIQDVTIRRLQKDIDDLKAELNHANSRLATRNGFKSLVLEMKKQLDAANERELERQSRNLALELDNEKLKTLLSSKTNLVAKMKKEMINMKRILKVVIKSISFVPQMPENYTFSSDPEYDDFQKELRKNMRLKFLNAFEGAGLTFDSTLSKDLNSFEVLK